MATYPVRVSIDAGTASEVGDEEKAHSILGWCICHPAYKDRGVAQSDCAWCQHGAYLIVLLEGERAAALEKAAQVAEQEAPSAWLEKNSPWDAGYQQACANLAAAFRALIPAPERAADVTRVCPTRPAV